MKDDSRFQKLLHFKHAACTNKTLAQNSKMFAAAADINAPAIETLECSLAIVENVIAVVDDDAGMRRGLRNVLSAHGYGTELFASAEEFLASAPTSNAKCVVIDIQLGGMSGIDLAYQLSASGNKIPIIFITGSVDASLRRRAMKVDYIAYLLKPFPSHLLLAAIKTAIARTHK